MKHGYQTADGFLYYTLKELAKKNRNNPTEAERLLWFHLRNEQLGVKFQRQHIIDCFIADIVCLTCKLVIEVDGGYHQLPEQKISDAERTIRIESLGFKVIRFTNEEIFNNIDNVIKIIKENLNMQHSNEPTSPSGEKRGAITIAIDGHSSCGKSTMAKQLAKDLGYVYVDTGAMYRSVTLFAMRNGLITDDNIVDTEALKAKMPEIHISFKYNAATGRPDTYLNGELVEREIRTIEVSNHVSPIAAIPFVREAMVVQQQLMGKDKGIVMDGRDIGTTVFPDAELKIFVTASAEVRAQRRFDELQQKGMPADFDEILKNVQERDYIDSHREVSPLRKADDAILLDNSHMTIPEQQAWLMDRVKEITSSL